MDGYLSTNADSLHEGMHPLNYLKYPGGLLTFGSYFTYMS
jgi:hypothetical protein